MNSVIREDLELITGSKLPWQALEGKTVLISGASGFLPAYLVHTLLYLNDNKFKRKAKVIAIARNKNRATERFAEYLKRKDFKLIIQDICSPLSLSGKVDYIMHAASQASPKYYGSDPVGTLLPNVIGTRNLLELARKHGSKGFLFFSGGEVYGLVDKGQVPTKETDYGPLDPMNVRSCYGESKRMGENMCACWHYQYGVPTKVIRLFHTYGPGMRLDDGRVFSDFVSDIVHKKNIVMESDGSATRSFCYLADAVIGMFLVLLKGKSGDAYNLGNDSCETSIRGLADTLVKLYPALGLKVVKKKSIHPKGYIRSSVSRSCPDISKIASLGWKPRIQIREGFKRTIRSYSL